MLDLRNLLSTALAASLLFSASAAEARFGKKSSDSSDSEKKEKKPEDREERSSGRVHDASAVTPRRTHEASPVGSSRPRPPPEREPDRVIVVEPAPPPVYYVEPAPPPVYYAAPARVVEPIPEVQAPRNDTIHSSLRMGVDGGPMGGGMGLNLFLAFEGELIGLDGHLTGLSLPTDDGTSGSDTITLANVHLTYALIAQERVRWRLEAGFGTAQAPDLKIFAPSVGTSFEARLVGPLDFEARLQGTPFPYRQIDTQAAIAFKAYPWVLRAGWRTLLLDDAGIVDGVVHRDLFNGPYAGLGLFF